MRVLLQTAWLLLIVPGVASGQAAAQTDSSVDTSAVGAEVRALREALSQAQKQLAFQQEEIDALKAQAKSDQSGALVNASLTNSAPAGPSNGTLINPGTSAPAPEIRGRVAGAAGESGDGQTQQTEEQVPPTSIKLGDAVLTPGGFVDFENIYRTTNTQNNIATAFAAIPFSNTPQGNVSELRTTAQFSRLNLKVTDSFNGNTVMGYVEGDFSGNQAATVYQSTSNLTNRLRLYFGMFQRGKWEAVGGQVWSWLTPNRNGIGPIPSDLAITYNEDQNIGVGLPYTRAAELRVAYHVNDRWAMGVGIEASNQFIGNFVQLPAAFSSIGSEFDNNSQVGTPNFTPDVLSKVTYDNDFSSRHFHAEIVGLFTDAHASVKPIGETTFQSRTTIGGGGEIAANYELLPNKLVLLANAFWSDGGAHYLVSTGPQLVVRPNLAGTDVNLSMVHAGAGSAGLEWRASQKEAFAVYYGADYYGRNFFPDTTNTSAPGTIIGYGGPGSPNTNNRAIQQATFDWLLTFWKNERYGALQYYTQYSYLTRAPWYVAPDNPKDAHLSMVYAGIRYVLPSTSGTLLRVPYPN